LGALEGIAVFGTIYIQYVLRVIWDLEWFFGFFVRIAEGTELHYPTNTLFLRKQH